MGFGVPFAGNIFLEVLNMAFVVMQRAVGKKVVEVHANANRAASAILAKARGNPTLLARLKADKNYLAHVAQTFGTSVSEIRQKL